ncbi:hypothetical protein BDP55DRAFT_720819 [Colletotrichum godetiae]|uniref:Uncharacterized protein n=1 Tax=Colletotrichum godetiae TaxID=1209918 RepID=A0AAJ0A844_9PEZI|nr:uncharacterized protein BDP55DRAFT_720819 [Colletotrichum godetiae]KAK1658281.1 hypothetical protein BDP55DRAFT_720819 [Colletotrichum godetiae]
MLAGPFVPPLQKSIDPWLLWTMSRLPTCWSKPLRPLESNMICIAQSESVRDMGDANLSREMLDTLGNYSPRWSAEKLSTKSRGTGTTHQQYRYLVVRTDKRLGLANPPASAPIRHPWARGSTEATCHLGQGPNKDRPACIDRQLPLQSQSVYRGWSPNIETNDAPGALEHSHPVVSAPFGPSPLRPPYSLLHISQTGRCAVQPRTAILVSSDSAIVPLQGLFNLHVAIEDDVHPAIVAAQETTGASHDELFWDSLDDSTNALQGIADRGHGGQPPGRRAESTPYEGRPGQVPLPFTMRYSVLQVPSRASSALWNGLQIPDMALVLVASHAHILHKKENASLVSQLTTSAPGLEASTVRLTLGLGGPGWGGGASCSEREAFSVA